VTVTAGRQHAGLALRNPEVQRLRRLLRQPHARRDEHAFVIEGPRLVLAALDARAPLEMVYAGPGADAAVLGRAEAAGVAVRHLAPGVVERVADAATPQPVLAVSAAVDRPLGDLRGASLVVACVDVRDPGNLGTVVRSAEAAGVGGILCCDGSVDVYNPKAVRASAGALFHVPVVRGGAPAEMLRVLGSWGMRRLGAAASGGVPHHRVDLTVPTVIVVGNEAAGLAAEVRATLDGVVTVPMRGGGESLNVGVAAAVLCFEADRQRRG
jgi:TrmH family RNA methyltransferase